MEILKVVGYISGVFAVSFIVSVFIGKCISAGFDDSAEDA